MKADEKIKEALAAFFQDLKKVPSRTATEFSYRTPMENLLSKCATPGLRVMQEPGRTSGFGAPDFVIYGAAGVACGHAECKKPGENLDAVMESEQISRYSELSDNLLVTDGLRWIWRRSGGNVGDARLANNLRAARILPDGADATVKILSGFLGAETMGATDSKTLALLLAPRCRLLRDAIVEILEDTHRGKFLRDLMNVFKGRVAAKLSRKEFADAFAQNIVYSLFLARLNAGESGPVDMYNVRRFIPRPFGLIRELARFLSEDSLSHHAAKWALNETLSIINGMDLSAVLKSLSFSRATKDPYAYFYEDFLAEYDPDLRRRRGVYYTPPPVVDFIVRAADSALRSELGLAQGLADRKKVTALDFAAGTGAFLLEMMRLVLDKAESGARNLWVREHLLKNFYGFERMIAPYTISHMKLSQFLRESGYEMGPDERIQIYLADTLTPSEGKNAPLLPALEQEGRLADIAKDRPILVIVGNPPYSGHSQNKGDWIQKLMRGKDTTRNNAETWNYFAVEGRPLEERNPKWLNDDYVKFFRFAQWKMDQVERGVVAVITNHAFLKNATFYGMRESLTQSFDRLYFLDLHGNTRRREGDEGDGDENVFDIQTGVAVSILIKNPCAAKGVYYADMRGKREAKYRALAENELETIKWKKIPPPSAPFYLFVPHNKRQARAYGQLWSVQDIFRPSRRNVGAGIVTARDKIVVGFSDSDLRDRITRAGHNFDPRKCMDIAYRPFDNRRLYNDSSMVERPRPELTRHMKGGGNIGLVTARQRTLTGAWDFAWIVDMPQEGHFAADINCLFPLWLPGDGMNSGVSENIAQDFREWLDNRFGRKFPAEDVFAFICAVLNAPLYREKYAQFLEIEFPRVPFPKKPADFARTAKLGHALIQAHLLREMPGAKNIAEYRGGGGVDRIAEVRYCAERGGQVKIDQARHFAPLPEEIWKFTIGGFRPIERYLLSRKGRELTLDEIERIQNIARVVDFTRAQAKKIGTAVADWI